MKKIGLIIAAKDFQPIEYNNTKEILVSSNQVEVITISSQAGTAQASDETTVVSVDLTLEQVETTKIDGLFLIGGPGALDDLDNDKVYTLLRQMKILKKPYGAICVSPRILAKAGVLEGLSATGWNQDNKLADIFKKYRVNFKDEPVVTDGLVVTADGPDSAFEFAKQILCVTNLLTCQV